MHFQRDNYCESFSHLLKEIRLHWYSEVGDFGSCDIAVSSNESPGQKYQQYIAVVLHTKIGERTQCSNSKHVLRDWQSPENFVV